MPSPRQLREGCPVHEFLVTVLSLLALLLTSTLVLILEDLRVT